MLDGSLVTISDQNKLGDGSFGQSIRIVNDGVPVDIRPVVNLLDIPAGYVIVSFHLNSALPEMTKRGLRYIVTGEYVVRREIANS